VDASIKILEGVLAESKEYYLDIKNKIEAKLAGLPKGSIKHRKISGRSYYYLQERAGQKVVHKYLGASRPDVLVKQLEERKALKAELKKVDEALRMLKRAEGRKKQHG
jgi:hypothetical protein